MEATVKLAGILVTAFIVGLSGAMMPGPLLAVTVTETARRGAWAGPLLIVGHMVLELVLVIAVALGLSSVLENAAVVGVIAFLGGGIMCWMGQGMLRSLRRGPEPAGTSDGRRMHPVLKGMVVSVSNPYWTIWWATIGLSYVLMGLQFGWLGVVTFFVGHILSDFAWYTLVSVGIAKGTRIFSSRVYRAVIGACGAILLVFGVWFFWTGAAALQRLAGAGG